MEEPIVDRAALNRLRAEVGPALPKLLGYFREDGARSVAAVEDAIRLHSAARLVIPAHTLKGESLQFGARPLAALAEQIELTARDLVETQGVPDALSGPVRQLGPLFTRTLEALTRELATAPGAAAAPRPAFGRRTFGTAIRQ